MEENRDLRETEEETQPAREAPGAAENETEETLRQPQAAAAADAVGSPQVGAEEVTDQPEGVGAAAEDAERAGAEEMPAQPEEAGAGEEEAETQARVEGAAQPEEGRIGEKPEAQAETENADAQPEENGGQGEAMKASAPGMADMGGMMPPAGPGAVPPYSAPQGGYAQPNLHTQPGVPPQGQPNMPPYRYTQPNLPPQANLRSQPNPHSQANMPPQGGYAPGGQGSYVPGNPAPYGGGVPPRGPYVPPGGNGPRPPLPPRPVQPPQRGLSQRAIIGLVITCCVTVLLSVLIYTVGMVLAPVFEAASYSMAWGEEDQGSSSGAWENWNNWYDNYNPNYPYDQGTGGSPDGGEESPVMEHTEDAHSAIEFLISGVMYATGAEIDEGNDGQEYVIVSLLASNLGTEEAGFRLSQITAQDGDGNVLNPVFPAYSYSLGLLPDSVTLKPKYQVRGTVVFPADNLPLTLVIREADGCEKRSIPIAPKD